MANREDDRSSTTPQRSGTGSSGDTGRERSSTQTETSHGHGTRESEKLGHEGGSKGSGGSSQHR
jgi:hypothetical protein